MKTSVVECSLGLRWPEGFSLYVEAVYQRKFAKVRGSSERWCENASPPKSRLIHSSMKCACWILSARPLLDIKNLALIRRYIYFVCELVSQSGICVSAVDLDRKSRFEMQVLQLHASLAQSFSNSDKFIACCTSILC